MLLINIFYQMSLTLDYYKTTIINFYFPLSIYSAFSLFVKYQLLKTINKNTALTIL